MPKSRALRAVWLPARAVLGSAAWLTFWLLPGGAALTLRPVPAIALSTMLLVALLLYPGLQSRTRRRRRAATLGLRGLGPAATWLAILLPSLLLTVSLFTALMAHLTGDPAPRYLRYTLGGPPLGGLVVPFLGIGIVPLAEEMAFRGFLQGRMTRRFGPVIAVAVTAALFAAYHGSRAWLPYYFGIGALLGYSRVTFRSLLAPIVLHSAVNATALLTPNALAGRAEALLAAPSPIVLLATIASACATLTAIRAGGRAVRRGRDERGRCVEPSV